MLETGKWSESWSLFWEVMASEMIVQRFACLTGDGGDSIGDRSL